MGEGRDVLRGGIQEAYKKQPCHRERLKGMNGVGGDDGGRGCFGGGIQGFYKKRPCHLERLYGMYGVGGGGGDGRRGVGSKGPTRSS